MDIVERLRSLNSDEYIENLVGKAADEIELLRKDKAELLKALTGLYEVCRWEKVCPTIDAAKDAIAKATGGE